MTDFDIAAVRFVDEPVKDSGDGWRGPYARDRARVLHSAAFRRLAAKTQVHADPASGDPLLRTRLTHSLEVAQIAREMGAALGCDPDVVDTAGLAHDLGHPPFGHNGEDALDEMAAACGGFEGNAQTLRLLTRLESKIVDSDGRSVGLNLTRASLDAVCKYPWPRQPGLRKFGVYDDDRVIFDWVRAPAPPPAESPSGSSDSSGSSGSVGSVGSVGGPATGPGGVRRCLEAQVMDWADDVAYSVHDVEDGIISGHVKLALPIGDAEERARLCADVAEVYSTQTPEALAEVLDELLADPALAVLAEFDGSSRALVALKHAASLMIGRFATAAIRATRERYGPGPLRRYDADLIVPERIRAQCALLKGIALRYVMRQPGSEIRYARERQVLRELVTALLDRGADALDPVFAPMYRAADSDEARLRVVIDQVASLTDRAALNWHARLVRR
ncbi:MAG: deoxyguanosinetriphosphate triphosphohydrolase family protein [Micromonosporaceae bacterium]|nr:deoxyguanosinetriphosphate triphosphohydrolase family protein [Micromonosporaceae bacterium]